MINQKLSQLMRDIADLKEVLGENRFKVVAYQKAAQILSSLSDDLEVIYKTKGLAGLKEIDGVGDAIAGHIEEFIKHHNVKEWERLKKKVAPAVLKLMDIPGIGPKTALKLADTLEVISVAGLQKALANVTPKTAVKLAKIGLKEKSINKILQGIDIAAKLDRRMRYVDAETIVREVENYMKRAPGIIKFDVVGSFRRKRETVGDLDFIATAADPGKAVAYFLKGPFVDKVIAHGPTKTTVIEPNGQQLDLEILPLREYGSLLQHFTGSKEHNVALRTWAVAHGFSISEHGIKVKGKLKRCSDEACVYQTLGMDWIPPELREDRGEIQAALAKQLPKLIETKDLKGDLQMHSNWSDGHATIYEMAKTAQKLGHEYIAITDHSPAVSVAHGLDAKRLAKQQKEIIGAQKKLNIKILSGCEVDIRADATLDLPDDVLKTLDFVICSIHSAFGQPKEQITKRLLAALNNPYVDALAHPTGRMIGSRPGFEADWASVFSRAAQTRKFVEINASPLRLDLNELLARQAKNAGVKFLIDTDAHAPDQLGNLRYGIAIARRAWLTKADVANTMKANDFISTLHSHRKRL